MNKKKKTRYFILSLFYVVGLIAGIALMFSIPYFIHRSQLMDMASQAAKSYSVDQTFGISNSYGLSYFAYDLDGNCLDQVVSGFQDELEELSVDDYLESIQQGESLLLYKQILLSNPYFRILQKRLVILIAAVPIKQENQITGGLFLIRDMEILPGTIYGFVVIWSLLFVLLFFFFYVLDKKQAKLDEVQRTYIASMNHELKTPITSIKSLSETLLDGYVSDPEKQFFYYSTILKEANTLEATVLEILELSKLQSTKKLYKKEICSLEKTFQPILARYASLCEDIDLTFHAPDLTDSALPQLYTAPKLASRVLDLLLHNAVKFTRQENGQIDVTFYTEKGHLRIDIRDNGIGISSEDLPHIFDRFYKSEKAHNSQGSGLGLSIVKEILDGLKETIRVESKPGNGTLFSFTIKTK
jgi:signal transduction histidine kinase